MYLFRTRPMMCERKAEVISTRVAVKTVCACVGRSSLMPRVHLERAGTGDWDEAILPLLLILPGLLAKKAKTIQRARVVS